VLAVQEASTWGWDAPLTLILLGAGVAATAVFVVTQSRVADPLVDVGLLRRRPFLADVAVNGLVQFGLLAAVLHSSLYLQDLLHFSPLSTGLAVLAMVLPITVAAQLGGRWFDRSGVRPPVLAGLTISTLGMFAWTLALPYLSYLLQVPGMVLSGLGLGLTISPTNTDALSRVAAADRSQASGVLQTMRQLGGTLGVAVVGAVVLGIEHRGTQGPDTQAAADAIAAGFAVSTAAFAVALLAAIRLLARERVAADPAAVSEALS
jgi:MFS family permease